MSTSNVDDNDNNGNVNDHHQEEEERQHQLPQRKAVPAGHERRVSWGGKLIEIPQVYNDNLMPTLLSEPSDDNDNGDTDNDKDNDKDNDNHNALRAKAASELVSTIEATMTNESIDNPRIRNNKHQNNHRRDESSTSAINIDDLAKMHPIESEAALEILKALETQDREQKEGDNDNGQQIDAVANLFTPANTTLFDNIPEGAEEIFQTAPRKMTHTSSVTGVPMSETGDSSQSRGRSRIDSSTIEDTTNKSRASSFSHHRINSMADPTTTVVRSPRQQQHNYDYRRRRRHHRRQDTMEERLFSLNQALDAADAPATEQNMSNGQNQELQQQQQENNTSDYNYHHHHRASTSLDLFNQNLARLFQDIDINPTGQQERVDEQEIVPLKSNIVVATTHPSTIDNNPTSNIGDDEKQDELVVVEDASFDDLSLSQSSAEGLQSKNSKFSASILKGENFAYGAGNSVQQEYQEQKVDDIEMGGGSQFTTTSNLNTAADNKLSSDKNEKKKRSRFYRFLSKIGLVHDMEFFLKSRTPSILTYLKNLFWLVLVAIIIAAVFFYGLGNPPIEYDDDLESSSQTTQNRTSTCSYHIPDTKVAAIEEASYSWWILFVLVRLPITFTLARSLEVFLIDFIILECRWVASCMGSTFTLLIVQAKVRVFTLKYHIRRALKINKLRREAKHFNHSMLIWTIFVFLIDRCIGMACNSFPVVDLQSMYAIR